jgi:cytochrome b6-f complex subunit 7
MPHSIDLIVSQIMSRLGFVPQPNSIDVVCTVNVLYPIKPSYLSKIQSIIRERVSEKSHLLVSQGLFTDRSSKSGDRIPSVPCIVLVNSFNNGVYSIVAGEIFNAAILSSTLILVGLSLGFLLLKIQGAEKG